MLPVALLLIAIIQSMHASSDVAITATDKDIHISTAINGSVIVNGLDVMSNLQDLTATFATLRNENNVLKTNINTLSTMAQDAVTQNSALQSQLTQLQTQQTDLMSAVQRLVGQAVC